jgi:hypothetical protein
MDVASPNQAPLVGRHVHPPQSDRTSTRCRSFQKTKQKNYSAPSTWHAALYLARRLRGSGGRHCQPLHRLSFLIYQMSSTPPFRPPLVSACPSSFASTPSRFMCKFFLRSARSRRWGPRSAAQVQHERMEDDHRLVGSRVWASGRGLVLWLAICAPW